jgi:hypothetical protein
MVPCPRCGTGNLKEGRSLSMHLTRYCSCPNLLFHAQRGTLAKKHSHELMFSGSCPSTYQQQIRNFNSLMVDVSVPTINTLHGMPFCHIYHQHNQNWETVMCITLGLTLTFLHQHLLMINLSLKNALFREIPYVYPLILHFKFICCHK